MQTSSTLNNNNAWCPFPVSSYLAAWLKALWSTCSKRTVQLFTIISACCLIHWGTAEFANVYTITQLTNNMAPTSVNKQSCCCFVLAPWHFLFIWVAIVLNYHTITLLQLLLCYLWFVNMLFTTKNRSLIISEHTSYQKKWFLL